MVFQNTDLIQVKRSNLFILPKALNPKLKKEDLKILITKSSEFLPISI